MFEWCSRRGDEHLVAGADARRPKVCATRLIASVVPRTKIDLARVAPRRGSARTFARASS